jgi:hypothetical protein
MSVVPFHRVRSVRSAGRSKQAREPATSEGSECRQAGTHDGDLDLNHGPVDQRVQSGCLIDTPAIVPEYNDSNDGNDC